MFPFSVLFVDDEPLTRRVTARLLGRHYEVFEAEGGKTALKLLETHNREINVVITDMQMDDMNGEALIDIIHVLYPKIPIIASTGDLSNYDFDALIDEEKIYASIEKPWDFDDALSLIRKALSESN